MPTLYKYRSLEDESQLKRLEAVLSTSEFWFANATQVNDPFEFRCAIDFTWDIERTAEAFAIVEMHTNPGISYPEALTKSRNVFTRVSPSKLRERQWELSYNMWKMWANSTTMCCLAGDATSLLMWSHYAGNHTGVAIEVEVPNEQVTSGLLNNVHKVEYSDNIKRINPLALVDMQQGMQDGLFETLFLRKAKCWKYEKEYRIMRHSIPNKGAFSSHQAPLPQGCSIKRVIMGCVTPSETQERIKNMISRKAPKIRIAYALPSKENSYELVVIDESAMGA